MKVTSQPNPAHSASVKSGETAAAKQTYRASSAQAEKKVEGKAVPPLRAQEASDARADISTRAKDFARAREVATSSPDVREEKIAALKRRIAEGKYEVNADKIAERLVDDHLGMAGIG